MVQRSKNERSHDRHASGFTELLAGARAGDRDALGRLIDDYRDYLLLIANQELDPRVQGKLGASDLVQDTMLRAQNGLGGFRGSTPAEWHGWLRQILINDLRQADRRYCGTEKRDVACEIPIHGDSRLHHPPVDIPAGDQTPSRDVSDHEEQQALYVAMARLPVLYRDVLVLRNWKQQSFAEIGQQIGKTDCASRKLWSRAVLRLQSELGRDEPSADG